MQTFVSTQFKCSQCLYRLNGLSVYYFLVHSGERNTRFSLNIQLKSGSLILLQLHSQTLFVRPFIPPPRSPVLWTSRILVCLPVCTSNDFSYLIVVTLLVFVCTHLLNSNRLETTRDHRDSPFLDNSSRAIDQSDRDGIISLMVAHGQEQI